MELRLILISCFLSIVPLTLIQAYQYYEKVQTGFANQSKTNSNELQSSAEEVISLLKSGQDTISLLSQLSLPMVSIEFNRPEALNEYLKLTTNKNHSFKRIDVFDSRKEFFTSSEGRLSLDEIKKYSDTKDIAAEIEKTREQDFLTIKMNNGSPTFYTASRISNADSAVTGFLVAEFSKSSTQSILAKLESRILNSNSSSTKAYFTQTSDSASECTSLDFDSKNKLYLCYNTGASTPYRWLNKSTMFLMLAMCGLAFTYFFVYRFFISRILQPLYSFLHGITRLTSGDFQPIPIVSKYPEVNKLIEVSNSIGKQLEKYQAVEIEKNRNEAVAKVAAQVAHDIKSPLTSLEYLLKQSGAKFLENERLIAFQSLERINDIVSTLALKKSNDLNSTIARPEIIDLLVQKIVSEKRLEYLSSQDVEISVVNELPKGTFVLIAKADFYRTMSNLINNAAEARVDSRKASIEVRISLLSNKCLIEIKDNGRGIPETFIDKVLEAGISFDKPMGSGIGLTSAKETIEQYDGKLSLKSSMDVGTSVFIQLPITSKPSWYTDTITLVHKNICVIDDDSSIHSIWTEILSKQKLSLRNFRNEDKFREWIKSVDSSMFFYFFDLELLGSSANGLDLVEEFGLEKNSILVTSHYDDEEVQHRANRLGIKIIPKEYAAEITISQRDSSSTLRIVLIDDDHYVYAAWDQAGKAKNIQVDYFKTIDQFLDSSHRYTQETKIFVDSYLGEGIQGEVESKRIFDLGFQNIVLTSGAEFASFPNWIMSSQGKGFPF